VFSGVLFLTGKLTGVFKTRNDEISKWHLMQELWQAKHDKSGLSSKSPIESQ